MPPLSDGTSRKRVGFFRSRYRVVRATRACRPWDSRALPVIVIDVAPAAGLPLTAPVLVPPAAPISRFEPLLMFKIVDIGRSAQGDIVHVINEHRRIDIKRCRRQAKDMNHSDLRNNNLKARFGSAREWYSMQAGRSFQPGRWYTRIARGGVQGFAVVSPSGNVAGNPAGPPIDCSGGREDTGPRGELLLVASVVVVTLVLWQRWCRHRSPLGRSSCRWWTP